MWLTIRKEILRCFFDHRFLIVLLIINTVGSLYGYYWYREQLASTEPLFLLFVPDSPLSTTLFSVALFYKIKEKKMVLLPLLASAFLVKYGLWAVAINLHLLAIGEGFTWINIMLASSHFAMAVEGVIYYPFRGITFWEVFIVTGILIFQDFMDYVIGFHPYLFNPIQYEFALQTALVLTGVIVGFIWYHKYLLGERKLNI